MRLSPVRSRLVRREHPLPKAATGKLPDDDPPAPHRGSRPEEPSLDRRVQGM